MALGFVLLSREEAGLIERADGAAESVSPASSMEACLARLACVERTRIFQLLVPDGAKEVLLDLRLEGLSIVMTSPLAERTVEDVL